MRTLLTSVILAGAIGAYAGVETKWQWTGWGGGGFFWAAQFHPTDPDTLYLAGDVAGIYKTTDRALSWRMVNRDIQNYAVYALAIAPSNPEIIYAMTIDGMARSDDAGETWKPLAETRAKKISARRGLSVRPVAVHPTNPAIVYAGSGTGELFKSVDAGETWQVFGLATGVEPAVASVVIADNALFICHRRQGLFRVDENETATRLEAPSTAAHVALLGNRAYGAFGTNGAWRSDDAGATWKKLPGISAKLDLRETAIDPRDPDTVHFIALEGWNGFHSASRDGGATWTVTRNLTRDALSNPTLPGTFHREPLMSRVSSLTVSPAQPGTLFIAGNWNNLLSTDGGASWQQRDHGTDITCHTDVRFAGGLVFATAMDQGVYVSRDNGAVWEHLFPPRYKEGESGHQWRVLAWPKDDGGFRVLSTSFPWRGSREYPNTVLISGDSGKTFTAHTAGLPGYVLRKNTMWGEGYARALAEDPNNPGTLYLGIDGDPEGEGKPGGGIFKSVDSGKTWQHLPNQPGSRRMFYGLVVDPGDSNTIYWGACGENSGVWRTRDAGETWEPTPLTEWVFNLEATASGTLYAGANNLWQSRDRATSWRKLTDFKNGSVVGIAVDPEDENRIWISLRAWGTAATGGVFRSEDGGETWVDITGDLPYVKPIVLRYNSQTRELWAAGTGIFKARQ